MARDQRRLAAIVSADVAGYSRLMGQDESGTLATLKAHRRELIDPKTAEYGGRIVKTSGDGLLLEFPSVVDAVRCAVDVQRGMAERNAGVLPDRRIEFRVGINVGDIIIDGDDIFGDGVNVAARLQALADPGEICVSKVVRDQVLDKLSFVFEDLGAQEVKNIARPVEVYRIRDEPEGHPQPRSPRVISAAASLRGIGRQGRWLAAALTGATAVAVLAYLGGHLSMRAAPNVAPPAMSVAIMPLAVSSRDAAMAQRAQEWSNTIAAMVALSDPAIRVFPVPSSRGSEAGANLDVGTLTRALNVGYVLEGDLRSGPEGVIGDMHLTNGTTGEQVWSGSASLKSTAIRDDEMRALRKIAYDIAGSLGTSEIRRVLAQPASDGTAMDYTLRARAVSAGGEAGSVQKSREAQRLFEEALRRDANFVPALVGLAAEMSSEIDSNPQVDYVATLRRWDEVSGLAVRLNPAHPDVWGSRWGVLGYLGQWNSSLQAIERAVQLDPYGGYVVTKGWVLSIEVARPAEAVALVEQYMALNPPGGFFPLRVLCEAHLLLGQYEQAIARCERAKGLNSEDWWLDVFLAAAYANHGDMAKATAARDEVLRVMPGYSIARLKGNAYSTNPEFIRLAEAHFHSGLRKAGLPEK